MKILIQLSENLLLILSIAGLFFLNPLIPILGMTIAIILIIIATNLKVANRSNGRILEEEKNSFELITQNYTILPDELADYLLKEKYTPPIQTIFTLSYYINDLIHYENTKLVSYIFRIREQEDKKRVLSPNQCIPGFDAKTNIFYVEEKAEAFIAHPELDDQYVFGDCMIISENLPKEKHTQQIRYQGTVIIHRNYLFFSRIR